MHKKRNPAAPTALKKKSPSSTWEKGINLAIAVTVDSFLTREAMEGKPGENRRSVWYPSQLLRGRPEDFLIKGDLGGPIKKGKFQPTRESLDSREGKNEGSSLHRKKRGHDIST